MDDLKEGDRVLASWQGSWFVGELLSTKTQELWKGVMASSPTYFVKIGVLGNQTTHVISTRRVQKIPQHATEDQIAALKKLIDS